MAAKKWVMYGVSGALGLGVLAGAATLTASAMQLHTNDGNVLDGGGVDAGTIGTIEKQVDHMRVSTSPTSTVSPTPSAKPGVTPGASNGGQPVAPAAPPAPAPVPVDPASPISVPSASSAG